MLIPTDPDAKARHVKWIIDGCLYSRKDRKDLYDRRRRFYLHGSGADEEVRYNRLESHLDLVCAFLYSAESAQFALAAAMNAGDDEVKKFMAAQDQFNSDLRDAGLFDFFGDALIWSLVYDSIVLKAGWSNNREEMTIKRIAPWNFGVFSEEEEDLDSQQAFVHSYHIDYDNAVQRLLRAGLAEKISRLQVTNTPFESPFPELITRMIITATAGSSLTGNVTGAVNPSYMERPTYQAKVDRPLVLMHELTVWDDKYDDYRMFMVVDPDIIISDGHEVIQARKRGKDFQAERAEQDRFYNTECNEFLAKEHPFVHIRPYQVDDYFWGKAHLESLMPLQEWSNERLEQIHDILEKQAYPPRVGSGFLGLSDEKMEAFGGADSWVMDQLPNASIKELVPEMPPDIFADFTSIGQIFLEASGLTEILQGRGEAAGVRSRAHAKELKTTGAGRIKKAAVRLEAPLVRLGDLGLKLMMRNDPEAITPDPREDGKPGDPFYYHNLGDRYTLRISGHSHSPLFVDDTRELAALLFKAQAIDQEMLIRLMNPPNKDNLIHALRTRMRRAAMMRAMNPGAGAAPSGKQRSKHASQAQAGPALS